MTRPSNEPYGVRLSETPAPARGREQPLPDWMGAWDPGGILVLRHPDAVRHVLQDNQTNYIKGTLYDEVRHIFGQGMITSDGPTWAMRRRAVQPMFHADTLERYHPVMVETIAGFLDEWRATARPGRAVEVSRAMFTLSLRVLGRAVFDLDLRSRERSLLRALSELLTFDPTSRGRLVGRLYRHVPAWARWRSRRAQTRLERDIIWVMERSGSSEIVGRLSDAAAQCGFEVRTSLRDEIATFLVAGHETSALGLAWALHLLSQHQETESTLRTEIARVLGDRRPLAADVPRLAYATMVLRETLRLYPPVPTIGRQAVADDTIAGYPVKAGTPIRIKVAQLHREPGLWPDPERFLPERFAADSAASRPAHAYIPFGAGGRTCIGNAFAMREMTVALAMILQAARLRPAHRRPVSAVANMSLRPRHGLWMIPQFFARP